eukprot:TRINITY_DN6408_c0_g1_i2.p1 TRINITY_DN6408_c0_g1~~TRINITY_DN6408_c0_g1_i2.p1  ORF type:complete len:182 (-),score=27.07 TRINITY_DN6408_c0_g1_i2:78-623(-)
MKSRPNGDYIEYILSSWCGQYELLEAHHGYIQWLFPLYETGVNSECPPLVAQEAEIIKSDPECRSRLVRSYQMMLHFYGMEIVDKETGSIKRHSQWKYRYENLEVHPHNFMRITRILKSLGDLGFQHYQKPLIEFLIDEIYVHGELKSTEYSLINFWVEAVKDDKERAELEQKIISFKEAK